ncbi:hypothetical protein [Streptomyces jumonjinensis]|uniref:Uncharacterized protein n=1 Tax=Streptomyces jumonjinensis TaxID=1945 RepID=A0A646KL06_STRJU|nr:hypothetical protein [Streptomyces jumonjinensis]MQT02895.1 hypothetical protein [Streptomyces jumonjinensis]
MGRYEYAFATPDDLGGLDRYRAWCAVAGLPAINGGYGLLMVDDSFAGRVTRLTEDVEYVRTLVTAGKTGSGVGGLQIPPGVFPLVRPGWPDEWKS